jgi:ABC-type sugar transport system substrate-binding protein
MKKLIGILLALLLVTLPLSGFAATPDHFSIGVACFSLQAEFPATINETIHSYIKELGLADKVDIISVDAQADAATQVGQVDNLIAQGVAGIILLPMDADACVPAVEAAHTAGIPLVTCNGIVNSDLVSAKVLSNDVVAGELEMKYIAEKLGGKGKIAILHGPSGISAEILRREGYANILKDYPDIQIVAEPTCNWSREEAMSTTENLIQANPDLAAIVAQNDEMAMGALTAVKDAGAAGKIIVGGIDAIADACTAVKNGELDCTVFQDAIGQAKGSVDVMLKLIAGEKVEDMDIPFILVTKDNVDQYIK